MAHCFGINTPHCTKAADTCSRRNIYCISRRPPVPDGGHARTHARTHATDSTRTWGTVLMQATHASLSVWFVCYGLSASCNNSIAPQRDALMHILRECMDPQNKKK